MKTEPETQVVAAAFEPDLVRIAFDQIAPLYIVSPQTKETVKFKRIASSIEEIGLVEPLVVARDKKRSCSIHTFGRSFAPRSSQGPRDNPHPMHHFEGRRGLHLQQADQQACDDPRT